MSLHRHWMLIISTLMLCSSCIFNPPSKNSIQIKGSDTMVNLVQTWAEEFMLLHPDIFIAVTGGGSGTGIASLINGTCDMAMTSRNIKPKEIKLAEKRNIYPYEMIAALDGLAVVVHPENPVSQLTIDQLAKIFSGHITDWKDVGGRASPIVILSREVNSGTHLYFKEHVIRHNQKDSQDEFSARALLLSSSQAVADEVASNTKAIGYYGMGYISSKHKTIAVAFQEGSPYIEPTIKNVMHKLYPISRPLYLYTNGEPNEALKKFIAFTHSDQGQRIVLENDFVPSEP